MNLNKELFNAVLNEIMVTNLLFEEGVKHLLREFVLPLYFTCTMLKRKIVSYLAMLCLKENNRCWEFLNGVFQNC